MAEKNARRDARYRGAGRRWYLPVAVGGALVGALTGVLIALAGGTTYTARTQVLVNSTPGRGEDASSDLTVVPAAEQQLAMSASVAGLAARRSGGTAPAGRLRVSYGGGGQLFTFAFTGPTARAAVAGADVYASAYLTDRRQRTSRAVGRTGTSLARRLKQLVTKRSALTSDTALTSGTALPSDTAAPDQASSLDTQIADVEGRQAALATLDTTPGWVTGPAAAPAADRRSPTGFAGLGALAGTCLALAAAHLRRRFGGRVHDGAQIAAAAGTTVLSPVTLAAPDPEHRLPAVLAAPAADATEPWRVLALRVRRAAGEAGTRTLMVVSPHQGDGRTTVTSGLAAALAETGERVIAVSADLRRPALHLAFGIEAGPGLTEAVLAGATRTTAPSLPVRRAAGSRYGIGALVPGLAGRLGVVQTGAAHGPAGRTAVLTAPGLPALLAGWSRGHDLVVLDSGPALGPADTLAVAPLVDAVLVVGAPGRTRRGDLARLRTVLADLDVPVLGAVAVDRRTLTARAAVPLRTAVDALAGRIRRWRTEHGRDLPRTAGPVADTRVADTPISDTRVVDAHAAGTPAVQAPVVQAPAVQAPAVQAPAVQAPAVQAPADRDDPRDPDPDHADADPPTVPTRIRVAATTDPRLPVQSGGPVPDRIPAAAGDLAYPQAIADRLAAVKAALESQLVEDRARHSPARPGIPVPASPGDDRPEPAAAEGRTADGRKAAAAHPDGTRQPAN